MQNNKKIGLLSLIMMIFSSIFGFANMPVAFLQMGYASIIWYIFAAIFFFLPVAMMLAEYGATFKSDQGGIYSWLKHTLGEKWAFIGTFIWLSSWIIWLLSISTKIYIPFSALLFGKDLTQTWAVSPLNATQVIGILGILWMLLVTFCASRGVNVISKVSSIGGTFVSAMVVVFLLATGIAFVANHGQMQEALTSSALVKSPNPDFQSPVATLSFVVYAIFAYAGLESLGGMIDSIDKPEKTFPKGLIISSLLIAGAYSLMILLWGVSTNWQRDLSDNSVNLGNITYVMMQHLGVYLGQTLGLSTRVSTIIGSIFIRFVGLGMFLAYVGSFFILIYSPIKSFILGSKNLWPEKMTKLNQHGIPEYAMWMQALLVCVLLFLISFGGGQAKTFYTILTDMSNVSTSVPYLFLVWAFPIFKQKQFDQPFEVYKKPRLTKIITWISFLIILFGVIFTCLQPFLDGDYVTGLWTIIGPVFFGSLAWIIYHRAEKKAE
ncbi:glutamate/gamma-aminobutyrate family transporter YjeM [Lactobacillus gigeriorum]|uniref:Amino acid permease n=1 Tax=Lactobacillus gigeriorum DSM 23908 = CRBIP 24.85 TaxID=1423751 RepID=I7KMU4_9LACO|nr:glutamate/gamma-aminobutyrate family transporter YjeM [Lactobacillus gigeriorum]KRN12527.1 amino acid permease [Lactobacillus gigeriorum DSM 23908 = CRBIP 24.85]CCI86309.1 Amino acid permease [Lactobacillus gigeriorum DSM 23908 = CRBIP 24.85]